MGAVQCVYKKYDKYAPIEFKFGCLKTTESLHKAIQKLDFNPTKIQRQIHQITGNSLWRFHLSRQAEIEKFFIEVVPKNQKHQQRYRKIKDGNAGI